jgi:hypothetical protein
VSLTSFGSPESEAMHDSVKLFPEGEPLDRTVLRTVDEFCLLSTDDAHNEEELSNEFVAFSTKGLVTEGIPEQVDQKCPPPEKKKEKLKPHECGLMMRSPKRLFVDGKRDQTEYAYVWPYYMNVLLLAYRKDRIERKNSDFLESIAKKYGGDRDVPLPEGKWISPAPDKDYTWEKISTIAEAIDLNRKTKELPTQRKFWFDHSAPEALSCVLLDALMSASYVNGPFDYGTRKGKWPFVLGPERAMELQPKEVDELAALHQLFQMTEYDGRRDNDKLPQKQLPEDANIYLCWYSQLRELISRQPKLACKLGICPLPGRGFTGDWFIGIAKGSVSPPLGAKVISMLCRSEEDYKRYSRGVGLPVYKKFGGREGKFFAWPRCEDILLERVLNFHADANSRSDIPGYGRLRSTIYIIAKQLTRLSGPAFKDDVPIRVKNIVGRLFEQIAILRQ